MKILNQYQLMPTHRIMCFELNDVSDIELNRTPIRTKVDHDSCRLLLKQCCQKLCKDDVNIDNDYINTVLYYIKNKATYKVENKKDLEIIINHWVKNLGYDCDLNWIDVSEINDFRGLFIQSSFKGNISNWTISNEADCSYMFAFSEFDNKLPQGITDMSRDPKHQDHMYNIFLGCPLDQKNNKN